MFEDITNKFEDFNDLSETLQEDLLKEIIRRGKQDKSAFQTYIQGLDFGLESTKAIFYEALWDDPEGWDNLILSEIESLVKTADKGDEAAIHELTSLFYLAGVEDMTSTFYEDAILFLEKYLTSGIPDVRQYCFEGIMDILDNSDYQLTSTLKKKMQNLLADPSFSVRINTFSYLKEEKLLPKDFKLSFLDTWRAKLTGKGSLID